MNTRPCLWVLFATIVAAQNSATITNCDTTSIFQVQSLDIQPAVPAVGENISMTFVYDAPEEIVDGIAQYSCSYNGLPYSSSKPLCTQTACPITIGRHTEFSTSSYSGLSGKLVCTIEWLSLDNTKTFLCAKSTIKLSSLLRGLTYNISAPVFNRTMSEPLGYNYNLGLELATL